MHPLYGALPVPYVPVRVTRGALVAYRYMHVWVSFLQNMEWPQDLYSVSIGNDVVDPVFDGVGL